MRAALPFFVCLLLAGCNENEAITQSASPPLLLGERTVGVVLVPGYEKAEIERAVASLGGPRGVHAVLNDANVAVTARAAEALRLSGIDSARIQNISDPNSKVVLQVFTLALPDCAGALHKSWFGDVSNSMTALGQCTSARAMGEELSDPGDLVSPAHLQFASGARFGHIVQLWEEGDNKQGGSTSGGGGSSGGSSAFASGDARQAEPAQSPPNAAQSGFVGNPLLPDTSVTSGDKSE